jgi:hypothetical protein
LVTQRRCAPIAGQPALAFGLREAASRTVIDCAHASLLVQPFTARENMYLRVLFTTIALAVASPASAWGPDGHHTIGALADKLIAGTNAATQVAAILNGISLQDAAVWADCAKGIDPSKNFTYQSAGKFPECAIFENPSEEAAMSDFVRRNDTNCPRKPDEESCHKEYHYADVAIQHGSYKSGLTGTHDYDVVAALTAAIRVLSGATAPAPFNVKDRREALLLLAHYVGDIHQPLHVGAVYLNSSGNRVNPDAGSFDAKTETRGGNDIAVTVCPNTKPQNLHAYWDAISDSSNFSQNADALIARARAVPSTAGDILKWPAAWATESVKVARQAFQGLHFTQMAESCWGVTLPATYNATVDTLKQNRITQAGARLAQILKTIFP